MKKARGFVDTLGRGTGDRTPRLRKRLKRQASKLMRRLGKGLLDDTPRRVTTGYAD